MNGKAERSPRGARLERLVRERWRGSGGMRGLAHALGVSRPTLYSWFRGDSVPRTEILGQLATLLDSSPAELLNAVGLGSSDPPFPGNALASTTVSHWAADRLGQSIGEVVRGRSPEWCGADAAIGPVAQRMYERNFSQIPVRDHGQWTGVLTTESIARWMAGRSERDLEADARAPVREVAAYAEGSDDVMFIGPDEPTTAVRGAFETRLAQGQPLAAVLVVTGANRGGELMGIVTAYDLPRLGDQLVQPDA